MHRIPDLQDSTVSASVDRLSRQGLLRLHNDSITVPAAQRARLLRALATQERAVDTALQSAVEHAATVTSFSDADRGRAERNARRLLADLVRQAGPMPSDKARSKVQATFEALDADGVFGSLGPGLKREQTAALAGALQDFLSDQTSAELVGSLVRSYAVLAVCQLDPVGKQFSGRVFRDRNIYLDTDTVVGLLIRETPEAEGVRAGISALRARGARIVVFDEVLEEATDHFAISDRTFDAIAGLKRHPRAHASARINNILVRGYYYADRFGPERRDFLAYKRNYYDEADPIGFAKDLLADLDLGIGFGGSALDSLTPEERQAQDRCAYALAKWKETQRSKAPYRDLAEMEKKADLDASLALIASRVRPGTTQAGVVLSDDSAYAFLERTEDWSGREQVRLRRSILPTLAELFGEGCSDTTLAHLVLSPIAIAVGFELKDDIDAIARQGVDLSRCNCVRLQRDLTRGLASSLGLYRNRAAADRPLGERIAAIGELHRELARYGYSPDSGLGEIVRQLEDAKANAKAGADAVDAMKSLLTKLVSSSEATVRYRRRIRRAVRDVGLSFLLEGGDPADDGEDGAGPQTNRSRP